MKRADRLAPKLRVLLRQVRLRVPMETLLFLTPRSGISFPETFFFLGSILFPGSRRRRGEENGVGLEPNRENSDFGAKRPAKVQFPISFSGNHFISWIRVQKIKRFIFWIWRILFSGIEGDHSFF